MKKVWLTICAYLAAAGLLLTPTGCGRADNDDSADPSARNQLILRLFESIERRDYEASSQQAVKLRALDPGSIFLSRMVDIQTGNLYVTRAQRLLDAGDYAGAAALVDEGARRNPLYLEMEKEVRTVHRVGEVARMVAEYRNARAYKDKMAALKTKDDASWRAYIQSLATCARLSHRIAVAAREFDHAALTKAAEREYAAIDRESQAEHKRHNAELAAARAAREKAAQEKEAAAEPKAAPEAKEAAPEKAAAPESKEAAPPAEGGADAPKP